MGPVQTMALSAPPKKKKRSQLLQDQVRTASGVNGRGHTRLTFKEGYHGYEAPILGIARPFREDDNIFWVGG